MLLHLLWILSSAPANAAPPAIAANGVSNAASRIPSVLPGGAVARGARILIDGVRFGSTPAAALLTIRGAASSKRAPLLAVTPSQIEARIPLDAPLGPASLVITANGEASAAYAITVVDANPGIYARNHLGWGPGAIDNLAGGRRIPNTANHPARAGESIVVRATGLGGTVPRGAVIGNTAAKIRTIRRDVQPGIDELVVEIPADVVQGCFVPLRFHAAALASNTVTVAIHNRPGSCVPSPAFPMPHWKPGNSAVALLARSHTRELGEQKDTIVDELLAAFFDFQSADALASPFLYGLPPGGCSLVTAPIPEAATQSVLAFLLGRPGEGIEAGSSITVNNARFQRRIPQVPGAKGLYRSTLSGRSNPRLAERPVPLLLDPGPVSVRSAGGGTVGAFAVTLPASGPVEWGFQGVIHSTQESLHIEWRTPITQRLVLAAASAISATSAATICLCLERASRREITIPAELMRHLPLSRQTPGQPPGSITLISWPEKLEAPIRSRGLVNGEAIGISVAQAAVSFQ